MIKKLFCLLLTVGLLFAGCAQAGPPPQGDPPDAPPSAENTPSAGDVAQTTDSPKDEATIDPLLERYLAEPELLETPVREYGDSASHIQLEEDFVARVLYPVGTLGPLDAAIERWVQQTAADYQAESVGSSGDGDSAELTVEYSSYLVGDTLVGVKLTGIYDRPYLAHPIDVTASFNASAETGELLALADLLLPGGEEALRERVMEQAGIEAQAVDENLLNHWLLTPGGLEITLVRGDYLPMSSGTVTLLYPYEELEGILALPDSTPPAPAQDDPSQGEAPPEESGSIPVPQPVDPGKPMLALTFDDGPSAHTDRLLDVFASHGGKGTFFVVGNMIDSRSDTLRRMAAEGHEIGGHSWNHRKLTKLSAEEVTDQLMSTRAKIYEVTGVDTYTMRPPYGSCNDQVKEVAGGLDIALINWSVDTLDWKHKNADTVYRAVVDGAADGAIILCHDLHKTTVDAMERAIPELLARGYQLVTVSELLSGGGEKLQAGKVYFKR